MQWWETVEGNIRPGTVLLMFWLCKENEVGYSISNLCLVGNRTSSVTVSYLVDCSEPRIETVRDIDAENLAWLKIPNMLVDKIRLEGVFKFCIEGIPTTGLLYWVEDSLY